MQFSESELVTLNQYLNGEESLPVEVEAINVRLREHFQQDTSVETPEVEEAVSEAQVEVAPVEEVPAPVTEEVAPVTEAPVEETVAPTE